MSQSTNKSPRNALNEIDIRAHKNLHKIWQAYKSVNKINQTDFAEDHLGWTQGNFSQYLTGQVRIGDKALAKLCKALNCQPWDVREELKDQETHAQLNNLQIAFKIVGDAIGSSKDVPESVISAYEEAMDVITAENDEDDVAVAA